MYSFEEGVHIWESTSEGLAEEIINSLEEYERLEGGRVEPERITEDDRLKIPEDYVLQYDHHYLWESTGPLDRSVYVLGTDGETDIMGDSTLLGDATQDVEDVSEGVFPKN
jgi:hypothetical protein